MRFTLTKGRQQVALESSQRLLRPKRLLKRILHRWQNYKCLEQQHLLVF